MQYSFQKKIKKNQEHQDTQELWLTSFQDGPIQNIVAQFAGDLNPPAYSIIKNIVNQSTAVITGDKNLWEGATSTFGFMSDLKYIGDKLD